MKEIGGYFEWERHYGSLLHDDKLALNCGRNALAYVLKARHISRLWVPRFLCASVSGVCQREGVQVVPYRIDRQWLPVVSDLDAQDWLYIVNYYGQLSNAKLQELAARYKRVIVDNSQSYFQEPVSGIDTLYTCRKYFGVSDGAFLSTDQLLDEPLEQDVSADRMRFVLGRFEQGANAFYADSVENNRVFATQPILRMSKLTEDILRSIDYPRIASTRTENFRLVHELLRHQNLLQPIVPEGAFMYPLYVRNGQDIRRQLQQMKIFVPTLWPDVLKSCQPEDLEYDFAVNILPLPIDQRYGQEDMIYMAKQILRIMNT